MPKYETLTVHVQDANGQTYEVQGDNAVVMVVDSEPFRSDMIKKTIRNVAEQDVIEVKHNGRKFVWEGEYSQLIVK